MWAGISGGAVRVFGGGNGGLQLWLCHRYNRCGLNTGRVSENDSEISGSASDNVPHTCVGYEGGSPIPSPRELSLKRDVEAEPGVRGKADSGGWRSDSELWGKLKPLARQMRREPTASERVLWERLRNRRLGGFKFRRQHSVERFIVDFYCAEAGLVVEIDGPVHQYSEEEDRIRQSFIEGQGLRVVRFSDEEVMRNINSVLKRVEAESMHE